MHCNNLYLDNHANKGEQQVRHFSLTIDILLVFLLVVSATVTPVIPSNVVVNTLTISATAPGSLVPTVSQFCLSHVFLIYCEEVRIRELKMFYITIACRVGLDALFSPAKAA